MIEGAALQNSCIGGPGQGLVVAKNSKAPKVAAKLLSFLNSKAEVLASQKIHSYPILRTDITLQELGWTEGSNIAKIYPYSKTYNYWVDNLLTSGPRRSSTRERASWRSGNSRRSSLPRRWTRRSGSSPGRPDRQIGPAPPARRRPFRGGGDGMSMGKRKRSAAREIGLSLLPVAVILVVFRVYPIITAVIKSFTNWDGLSRNDWVGVKNYVDLVSSGTFWIVLRNTLVLLLNVPLQVFVGLVVALLLYEQVKGWRIYRAVIYTPQIISAVIIGYLFRTFFSLGGPVNAVLTAVGLEGLAIEWFGNAGTALGVLILSIVWFSIGWQAIVILGACRPSRHRCSKPRSSTAPRTGSGRSGSWCRCWCGPSSSR